MALGFKEVGAGEEACCEDGGRVVGVCDVAVVVSVVRNRVLAKGETRKIGVESSRLGAAAAVRSGIWRSMVTR